MLSAILRLVINALILILTYYILPKGIGFDSFYAALITALVLSLMNLIIRPILIVLTLPINLLTLGLFTLVINAFLFWFASTIVKGFFVASFWSAFWAAIIFSLISAILNWVDYKINKNKGL